MSDSKELAPLRWYHYVLAVAMVAFALAVAGIMWLFLVRLAQCP